jgi:hypothetical protein
VNGVYCKILSHLSVFTTKRWDEGCSMKNQPKVWWLKKTIVPDLSWFCELVHGLREALTGALRGLESVK